MMGAWSDLRLNRDRSPELVRLAQKWVQHNVLGQAARSGMMLHLALAPHVAAIERIAQFAPTPSAS